MPAIFNLGRFVTAQEPVLEQVRAELKAGSKQSHWMWFVFPQIAGLGSSDKAQHFAIASVEEASSYLEHSVLGPRLLEFTGLVNAVKNKSARQIFGAPDDQKFHASMTLFASAKPDEQAFSDALSSYFGGTRHQLTLERIAAQAGTSADKSRSRLTYVQKK